MHFLKRDAMPRRTFLKGLGATVALPYLDAMMPALGRFGSGAAAAAAADKTRLVCIESVHGAAGSNAWGATKNLWAPATVGRGFELNPAGALTSLDPWRKYLTIVSNTDVRMAEPFVAPGKQDFNNPTVEMTSADWRITGLPDCRIGGLAERGMEK